MMNTVLAIGPLYTTRAVFYGLAVLALWACYRIWSKLANGAAPAEASVNRTAALGTLLLAFTFVLRDLDECGLQTFVLFFLSAAGLGLAAGKRVTSGFWLGTAAVYKVSPALCLPFLLWKRQWLAAAAMVAVVVLWFLAPAAYLGWDATMTNHAKWLDRARTIAAVKDAYPSQGELEQPMYYNLSLFALVARYVETYPPGHPLFLNIPGFVQFGNLEPLTAYYVVRGTLLALALMLAWRFRRAWPRQAGSADLASEWAAVCLLCALAAPVCWKQHMVLMLPALFLTVRSILVQPSWWRSALLSMTGVVFLGTKNLALGKDWSTLALSYKIDTLAALLLLLLVLTLPKSKTQIQAVIRRTTGRTLAAA
jgi:hypothetical protein